MQWNQRGAGVSILSYLIALASSSTGYQVRLQCRHSQDPVMCMYSRNLPHVGHVLGIKQQFLLVLSMVPYCQLPGHNDCIDSLVHPSRETRPRIRTWGIYRPEFDCPPSLSLSRYRLPTLFTDLYVGLGNAMLPRNNTAPGERPVARTDTFRHLLDPPVSLQGSFYDLVLCRGQFAEAIELKVNCLSNQA